MHHGIQGALGLVHHTIQGAYGVIHGKPYQPGMKDVSEDEMVEARDEVENRNSAFYILIL